MGKIIYGILAAIASFMLADSLVCNKCSVSIIGICLNSGNVTCNTNTSVCYTGNIAFPSVSGFAGFSNQGCREPAGCNATTNGTLLGATYMKTIQCCSTNNCNPVQLNGAPSAKTSATVALGAAIAAMWSMM